MTACFHDCTCQTFSSIKAIFDGLRIQPTALTVAACGRLACMGLNPLLTGIHAFLLCTLNIAAQRILPAAAQEGEEAWVMLGLTLAADL